MKNNLSDDTDSLARVESGAFVLTLFQVTSKVLLALFYLLLANRLFFPEAAFGSLLGILALVELFLIPADMGLETYTTRRLSRSLGETNEWIARQATTKLLLTLLACGLFVGWVIGVGRTGDQASDAVSGIVVLACVMRLAGQSAQSYLRSVSRAHNRMSFEGAFMVLEKVVIVGLGGIVLYRGASLENIIWCFALGALAAAIYIAWKVKRIEPVLRIAFLPDLKVLGPAFPFAISAVCVSLFYNMDRAMLLYWGGGEWVAPYGRGFQVTLAALLFPQMVSISLYPVLSQMKGDPEERLRVGRGALRTLFFIVMPVVAGGWALAGPLMDFIAGSDEAGGLVWGLDGYLGWDSLLGNNTESACLRVLLLGLPFQCGNYLFGPALNALNREVWNLRASALTLGVAFVANLAMIPLLGPLGAALATLLTQAIYCFLLYRYLRKEDGSWWRGNGLLPICLIAGLMGIGVWFMADIHLFIRIAIGGAAYLVAGSFLGMAPDWRSLTRGQRR